MNMASPEQDNTSNSTTLRTAELHLIDGAPQRCLEHLGETDEALDLTNTALRGWDATLGLEHPKALPARVHMIRLMTHNGHATAVVEDARSALRSHEQLLGPAHGNSVNAAEVAAACFIAAGRTDLRETLREFCDRAHSAGASSTTLSALNALLGGWVG
jgi:hypothetical protein